MILVFMPDLGEQNNSLSKLFGIGACAMICLKNLFG
jgi:hypothetical protein